MSERVPAIGLVLGGGGIAGYAFHGGVLAAIEGVTGFDPRTAEVIVGTSAGAIAAAALRGGVVAGEIRDRLVGTTEPPAELENLKLLSFRSPRAIPPIWTGPGSARLAMREVRRGRRAKVMRVVAGLAPLGRMTLDPVSRPIDLLHGPVWPTGDLWITATDLRSGRRVVFGRDQHPSVADAVTASAALPGFFAPAEVAGRLYVDGGIGSPFNADLLIERRHLDLVVVSAPLSIGRPSRENPLASLTRSVPSRQLRSEVARLEAGGVPVLAFRPDRAVTRAMGLNPMSHNRVDSIVTRSERLVERLLDSADPAVVEILATAAERLPRPAPVPYPVA